MLIFVRHRRDDYTGVSSAFEFDFNAGVANDLGCPIIAVVNGCGKSPEEVLDAIRFARDAFESQGCTLLAILANRVEPQNLGLIKARLKEEASVKEPVYILPEEPLLSKPTVGEDAADVRSHCCRDLSQLGIEVDEKKNNRKTKEILEIQSTAGAVRLLVIPSDEELEIAEQTVEKIKSIQKK